VWLQRAPSKNRPIKESRKMEQEIVPERWSRRLYQKDGAGDCTRKMEQEIVPGLARG
jgi:hypothetical protein